MRAALVIILPDLEDSEELPPLLQAVMRKVQEVPEVLERGQAIITIREAAEAVIREAKVQR